MFQSLGTEGSPSKGPPYWWLTSGKDIANMLHEADYPDDTQRQFLGFFRDSICPELGGSPKADSIRSGVGWDGNPFEYSFELKSSSKSQTVRFVVDLSELRPTDEANPLSIKGSEAVLDTLKKNTPSFDDSWYRALKKWFTHSHLSTSEQKEL